MIAYLALFVAAAAFGLAWFTRKTVKRSNKVIDEALRELLVSRIRAQLENESK